MMTYRSLSTAIGILIITALIVAGFYIFFQSKVSFERIDIVSLATPVAAICFLWVFTALLELLHPFSTYRKTEQILFAVSLLFGGIAVLGSFVLDLLDTFNIKNLGVLERIWGVIVGIIVMTLANYIPKTLSSIASTQTNQERIERFRRLTGGCLFIGGTGFALSHLALPASFANAAANLSLGLAIVLVCACYTWLRPGAHKTMSESGNVLFKNQQGD